MSLDTHAITAQIRLHTLYAASFCYYGKRVHHATRQEKKIHHCVKQSFFHGHSSSVVFVMNTAACATREYAERVLFHHPHLVSPRQSFQSIFGTAF